MSINENSGGKTGVKRARLVAELLLLMVIAAACAGEAADRSAAATTEETGAVATEESAGSDDDTEQFEQVEEDSSAELPADSDASLGDDLDTVGAGEDAIEVVPELEGQGDAASEAAEGGDVVDAGPESLALADDALEETDPGFVVTCAGTGWESTGTDEDGDGQTDFTLPEDLIAGFVAVTEPADLADVTYNWNFEDVSGGSPSLDVVDGGADIVSSPPAGHWRVTVTAEVNGASSSGECEGTFIAS